MATSEFAAGDVVVVPFPYSDRFAEKRRPALVVSADAVQRQGFIWVVMITSATHRALPQDLAIEDLALAGLGAPSLVRPLKIACLEPSRIVRKAGQLSEKQMAAVGAAIRSFIG